VSDRRRQRDSLSAIASTANDHIRYVKSLYRTSVRRKERLFVVEGVRLLEDALASGARPELVLLAPDQLTRTPRGAALHERLTTFNCLTVTDAVLKSLSDTVTPQGAVALFAMPRAPETFVVGPIVLILDHLRDPGNAGTILRSADASGLVRSVAFVDSVDAFSPKVVRAGMGAHFRLTILEDVQWSWLRQRVVDRPCYLATAEGGDDYTRVDWTKDCVVIVGGEAEGASGDATSVASRRVTIPMVGSTESLNAAMAGTVLLFEASRARRELARPAAAPAQRAEAPGRSPKPPPRRPASYRPGGPQSTAGRRPPFVPRPPGSTGSGDTPRPPGSPRRRPKP